MRNRIFTYIFIMVITLAGLFAALLPDTDITYSERRPLYSFNDLKASEDFSSDFEKYALDQFVLRDFFRRIKAFAEYRIFGKDDNNGLYEYRDFIIEMMYPMDSKSIEGLADKINKIVELYASDNSVYYSLVPDKNYFTGKDGYLSIDYIEMANILNENINENISYINIFNSLDLSDYYKTDHHYRIDGLSEVLFALGNAMDIDLSVNGGDYILKSYYPFYGAYYGQAAINIDPDTLFYLENDLLINCTVKVQESFDKYTEYSGVYDYDKLTGIDSYDFFLYGTKPVVTIENPKAETAREIIIFKDSFANSLVPLLVETYSKITLVDLRLVNHTALGHFIDFSDADILFLYSTMVANNSSILK
jgi:hypothetical protein